MPDAKRVKYSFLASGPLFSMDMPDDVLPQPILSSPLRNGRGGRSFDYAATEVDPGIPPEDGRLVDTLQGKDGHTVEVYEREGGPMDRLWWLRWLLPNGSLYTHIRDEDGRDFAEVTVSHLSLAETEAGTPLLLPDPPLRFGASAAPGYQELATFVSLTRGPSWSITMQRPGFVPADKTFTRRAEGRWVVRAGARYGMELQVIGESADEGRELASMIQRSLSDR